MTNEPIALGIYTDECLCTRGGLPRLPQSREAEIICRLARLRSCTLSCRGPPSLAAEGYHPQDLGGVHVLNYTFHEIRYPGPHSDDGTS
jgi:hypothetical protein